jgi:hypothetical protein
VRKLLYAVCALAFIGGLVTGCTDSAKADSPYLGEYLGRTPHVVAQIDRFQDGPNICYVAGYDRATPLSISCVRE